MIYTLTYPHPMPPHAMGAWLWWIYGLDGVITSGRSLSQRAAECDAFNACIAVCMSRT